MASSATEPHFAVAVTNVTRAVAAGADDHADASAQRPRADAITNDERALIRDSSTEAE